jgi:hypothetical protein
VTALERAADLSSRTGQRADRRLRAAEIAAETGRPAMSIDLLRREDMTVLGLPGRARAMIVQELAEFAPLPDSDRLPVLVETVDDLTESGDVGTAAFLLWKTASECWRASASAGQRGQLLVAALKLGLADDAVLLAAVRSCVSPLTWGNDVLRALARVPPGQPDLGTSAQMARAALFVGDYPQAARHAAVGCRVARVQGRLSLVTQLALVNAQAAMWCGNLDADRGGTAHGRPRTSPRTGAERPRTGPVGAVTPTAPTRISALTCHFRMLLDVAVVLVTGVFLRVLGAESFGDALVGGGRMAVDAVGVDLQQDRHAVPGAARDLGGGHPGVLPQ